MKKPRRPGTRGEKVSLPRPKAKGRLPSDIADAAEAALDDMIAEPDESADVDIDMDDAADDEPRTQTRAPSHPDVVLDDEEEELLTHARRHDSEVLAVARVTAARTRTFSRDENSVETPTHARDVEAPTQARGYNSRGFAPGEDSVEAVTHARGPDGRKLAPGDEPPTRARPGDEKPSHARGKPGTGSASQDATLEATTSERRSKMPLPAPARTTAANTVGLAPIPTPAFARGSPAPGSTPNASATASVAKPSSSVRSSSPSTPPPPRSSSPSTPPPARSSSPSTPPRTASSTPPPTTHQPLRSSSPSSTPGPSLSTPPPLRAGTPAAPPTRQVPVPKLDLPPLARGRSAATQGETPMTRGEHTTSERNSSLDQTAPLSDDDKLDAVLDGAGHEHEVEEANDARRSADLDAVLDGVGLDDELEEERDELEADDRNEDDRGDDSDPRRALEPEIYTEPVDAEQLIAERPELATLRIAVYEETAHLTSVQAAITAAGHTAAVMAAGRDGPKRVITAVRGGSIDAVIVTVPGGESIIDAALALDPRRPVVIASVGGASVSAIERAHAAGADLVITRPHDVEHVAPILFAASRLFTAHRAALAARGSEQVLRARLEEISDPEPRGLIPFEMFQRVLELEIKRAKRFEYPLSVALFAVEVDPPPPPPGIRGILRARAGNALIHTVRDIDMATQLDHERFLVLLPYTDLKGAANVGRRVIRAVAAGDPVVAIGRSFPPRLVGAVAGGSPNKELSFAKLMKDAQRALEQARRDGAELAVQP